MRTRFMGHQRKSSVNSEVAKHIHQDHKDHSVTLDRGGFCQLTADSLRDAKEAICIQTYKPSLNADGGRYKLPSVWKNLLESRVRRESGPNSAEN